MSRGVLCAKEEVTGFSRSPLKVYDKVSLLGILDSMIQCNRNFIQLSLYPQNHRHGIHLQIGANH